jgi:hypothetical protein
MLVQQMSTLVFWFGACRLFFSFFFSPSSSEKYYLAFLVVGISILVLIFFLIFGLDLYV